MSEKWRRNSVQKQAKEETFKLHLLKQDSILHLYRKRLANIWTKDQEVTVLI
jgi:hypothetical protein